MVEVLLCLVFAILSRFLASVSLGGGHSSGIEQGGFLILLDDLSAGTALQRAIASSVSGFGKRTYLTIRKSRAAAMPGCKSRLQVG